MSVALPPPVPDRIPGFVFTCRLAPDGTFTFAAPPAEIEQLYESSAEEMSKMLTAGRLPFTPDDGPELWASLRDSAANLIPWAGDNRVRGLRTGRERWVRVFSIPRREPDGAVVWNGLITDITDLKAVDARLREAVEELARSEARMRAAWMRENDRLGSRPGDEPVGDDGRPVGLLRPAGADYTNPAVALAAVHPEDVLSVWLGGSGRSRTTSRCGTTPRPHAAAGRLDSLVRDRGQVLRDADGKPLRWSR